MTPLSPALPKSHKKPIKYRNQSTKVNIWSADFKKTLETRGKCKKKESKKKKRKKKRKKEKKKERKEERKKEKDRERDREGQANR